MEETQNQEAAQQPQQTRVSILPAPTMTTLYTNAFHTNFSENDLLLTFCVSRPDSDAKGPLLTVQPEQRMGMTIESARRLVSGLIQALQQHDQMYAKQE